MLGKIISFSIPFIHFISLSPSLSPILLSHPFYLPIQLSTKFLLPSFLSFMIKQFPHPCSPLPLSPFILSSILILSVLSFSAHSRHSTLFEMMEPIKTCVQLTVAYPNAITSGDKFWYHVLEPEKFCSLKYHNA
jgi:hypothetical protein